MVKITVSSDNFEAIKNLRPGDSLVVGHVNRSNEVITMKREDKNIIYLISAYGRKMQVIIVHNVVSL